MSDRGMKNHSPIPLTIIPLAEFRKSSQTGTIPRDSTAVRRQAATKEGLRSRLFVRVMESCQGNECQGNEKQDNHSPDNHSSDSIWKIFSVRCGSNG